MSQLNYKHLRYFWAVAHDGNLTRAAATLNVSQSALSSQIRKLEEALGNPLFERRGRSLHLTEAGRMVLDHADAIFDTGDQLVGMLASETPTRPVLKVGAMAPLSRNFQIGFLRPVLERADVRIILRSGTGESLLAELEDLSLDIVLLNSPPNSTQSTAFRAHRLAEQQISLVGTPARLGKGATLQDLVRNHPLILPVSQGSIRTGFEALVQRLGIEPRIIAEANDMAMMRLLARQDAGIAVIPPVVVNEELQSGELIEAARLPGVFESFYAVTIDRRFPNPLLPELLQTQMVHADQRHT